MAEGDDHTDDDPFAGWTLDDAFVASAAIPEASAEERVRRPEPLAPVPPRRGGRRARRRARRRAAPARRGVTAAILVLVAVLVAAVARDALAGREPQAVAPEDQRLLIDGRELAFPTPAPSADTPLGTPPVVPDDDAWVPANVQDDGSPVAWDPCRPIRYVVGGGAAPDGAEGLVEEAMATVEVATGLSFQADGPTDEPLDEDRPPVQPDRYGDRWAPVLVAWTDPGEVPQLDGPVAGRGGPNAVARPGGLLVYTSGTLFLDGPQLADLLAEPGGRADVRGVILHELAHVIGLQHVDDPAELMYPESLPDVTTFGPGDRSGLARLGQGPCVPDL